MKAPSPPGPYVLDGLLFGAEGVVLPYLVERVEALRRAAPGSARAVGIVGRDPDTGRTRIIGGVAFSFYFPHAEGGDVQASAWIDPAARVTRPMLRQAFAYAFGPLDCRRITVVLPRRARTERRLVERIGFRVEAKHLEAHGRQALVSYGLLRSEMRRGLPPIRKRSARRG